MIRAEKTLIENESYPIMIAENLVVDASNKTCPLPVLYAKKALQTLSVNDTGVAPIKPVIVPLLLPE